MKQLLFIISFFALLSHKSIAAETTIPSTILHSFYSSFAEAKDVSWEQKDELTVASFYLDGIKKYAYYSEAAELLVVAENITLAQLPASLHAQLQEKFGKYTISEAFKIKGVHGMRYSVILESVKEKVFLSSADGDWEVAKRTRK